MSLIVEDGSGLANAESYEAVAGADDYHEGRNNSDWNEATLAQKEVALRKATEYLDARFHARWRGRRSHQGQALDWPRWDVVDADGFWVHGDVIPERIKRATSELALRALSETLLPDLSNPGDIKKERKKAGSVEKEVEYVGGKSQNKRFQFADALLRDYVSPLGVMERA